MSAATATAYDFFLIKTDATTVRLVSNTTPLTTDRLHEEFDFRAMGAFKIPVKDGLYLIWSEAELGLPPNPTAVKLFKGLHRAEATRIQGATATGNVAIAFYKYSYDGKKYGTRYKVRQTALPFTTLKEFLAHANSTSRKDPDTITKDELRAHTRPFFLWTDITDTDSQEAYFTAVIEDTWGRIRRHQIAKGSPMTPDEMTRTMSEMTSLRRRRLTEETTTTTTTTRSVHVRRSYRPEELISEETATPAPLPPSTFLAKLAADSAIRSGESCPIGLEPLSSYPTVCVPSCGHVCGPDAATLDKCPVCRTVTGWASVSVTPSASETPTAKTDPELTQAAAATSN